MRVQNRKNGSTFLILILTAIAVAASIFFILQKEHVASQEALDTLTRSTADSLDTRLEKVNIVLTGAKALWLASVQVTPEEFAVYGSQITPFEKSLTAIGWIDEKNIVRYVYPLEGENLKAVNFDNNPYPNRMSAILAAKESKNPVVSSPIIIVQGYPGLVIYVPIYRGDEYLGIIAGWVKLQTLFADLSAFIDPQNYDAQVWAGDKLLAIDASTIFTSDGKRVVDIDGNTVPDPEAPKPFVNNSSVADITVENQTWQLHMRRNVSRLTSVNSVAAIGIIFILAAVLLAWLLNKKNASLEETNTRERDFVSLVSHQLRIPLTELSWMIETVFETGTGTMTAEQVETVQEIRGIVRNSIKLINDLLNVSRLERGVIKIVCEEVLLVQMVNEALKPLIKTASEQGVRFEVAIPENMTVFADQLKAVEAIRNILDNAVKYGAKDGGVVEIKANEIEGFRTLTIRDHGPGIPKDIQPKLFDKASAFSPKGTDSNGSGLGLYLTKQFISRMGGEVSFVSSPEGTTFSVAFSTEQTDCRDEEN